MRILITGALTVLALAVAGCTTDGTSTETTEIKTAKKTINYTAWACKEQTKTVTGARCTGFYSSYGPGKRGARQNALDTCPGECRIIFVRQGCIPLTLDDKRVLRPKC